MLGFQRRSTVTQRPGRPRTPRAWPIATLAALAFGAPAAHASTTHLEYQCDYPYIGQAPLSVNVTTPDPSPDAKLPVLVWIHGGGFIAGSAASPWYVGEAFARDGVVTVTASYRLGFEGFGWVDGAVNNRAVLDWIVALTWVQDNIAAFGGDPDRVTIAGQSAGGAAVMRLLTLPAAQHLFRFLGQPRFRHRRRQRHPVGVHDRLRRLGHLRPDRHRLGGRRQPLGHLHADGHRRHHGLHRGALEQLGGLRRRQHRLVRRPHLEGQVVDDGRDPRHHR